MNKEEAIKILKDNNCDFYDSSNEVTEALKLFMENGEVSAEGWSYFYYGRNWSVVASVVGPIENQGKTTFIIPTDTYNNSEDNIVLIQELLEEAGCEEPEESTSSMRGANLTEEIVKERINDVFKKYGFSIKWEDIDSNENLESLAESYFYMLEFEQDFIDIMDFKLANGLRTI